MQLHVPRNVLESKHNLSLLQPSFPEASPLNLISVAALLLETFPTNTMRNYFLHHLYMHEYKLDKRQRSIQRKEADLVRHLSPLM
jgi:hypothetical protein